MTFSGRYLAGDIIRLPLDPHVLARDLQFVQRALKTNSIGALSRVFNHADIDPSLLISSMQIPQKDMSAEQLNVIFSSYGGEPSKKFFDDEMQVASWVREILAKETVFLVEETMSAIRQLAFMCICDDSGAIKGYIRQYIGEEALKNLENKFGASRVRAMLVIAAIVCISMSYHHLPALQATPHYWQLLALFISKQAEMGIQESHLLVPQFDSSKTMAHRKVTQTNLDLLYSAYLDQDPVLIAKLKADTGDSGKKYQELQQKLIEITKHRSKSSVNRHMIAFLKELFIEALDYYGVKSSRIKMEVCVAGSLARMQATPYSDIDCFVILGNDVHEKTKQLIQQVAERVAALSVGFFLENNQFMMDPIGISLSRLNGTVDELVKRVIELSNAAITTSILNAKSITGGNDLLESLQAKLAKHMTPERYFMAVVKEYPGPKAGKPINLKSDVLRPIDFLLQGLRLREGITIQEFDSAEKVLAELMERKKMSYVAAELIKYILIEAYNLRRQQHDASGAEDDDIKIPGSKEKIEYLVRLVGWIRGSFVDYLKSTDNNNELFVLVQGRYLSGKDDRSEDVQEKQFHAQILADVREGKYKQLSISPYELVSQFKEIKDSQKIFEQRWQNSIGKIAIEQIRLVISELEAYLHYSESYNYYFKTTLWLQQEDIIKGLLHPLNNLRTAIGDCIQNKRYDEANNLFQKVYQQLLSQAYDRNIKAIATPAGYSSYFYSHRNVDNVKHEETGELGKILMSALERSAKFRAAQADLPSIDSSEASASSSSSNSSPSNKK